MECPRWIQVFGEDVPESLWPSLMVLAASWAPWCVFLEIVCEIGHVDPRGGTVLCPQPPPPSPGPWGLDRPWQSHAPASLLLLQAGAEAQDPQTQHSSLQLMCFVPTTGSDPC